MISTTLAQGVGLSIWTVSLGIAWYLAGRRRCLPQALWIPGFVAALPLAFVLRGLFGDASLALPAMAWYASNACRPTSAARRLLIGILGVAALLYVSALGFVEYDLYAVGYAPALGLLLVGAALIAAYRWMPVLAWCWLLGLGLFAARLHPSPNLWDTLIDLPSICLAAAVVIRARSSKGKQGEVAGDCSSASRAPSGSSRPASD